MFGFGEYNPIKYNKFNSTSLLHAGISIDGDIESSGFIDKIRTFTNTTLN